MIDRLTLSELKLQIAQGEVDSVFVKLYELIKGKYSLLVNDLISLQGRHSELVGQIHRNLLDTEDQFVATARIRDELLRLIDQVPTREEVQATAAESAGGKLCHNIPGRLPVHISTKCVVKIAENESILAAAPGEVIEDIEIARVMEVSITDESGGEAFEISSPNTAEQYLVSGRNTRWIFHVKPLRLGNHTLYLQVNTLEMIEGQERKRNTVLEKELVVDTYERIQEDTAEWEDTGIAVGPPAPVRSTISPPRPVPAPAPVPARPSASMRPTMAGAAPPPSPPPPPSRSKRRAAMTMILPLMLGLVFAGNVFFSDAGFFTDIRETLTGGGNSNFVDSKDPDQVDPGEDQKNPPEDSADLSPDQFRLEQRFTNNQTDPDAKPDRQRYEVATPGVQILIPTDSAKTGGQLKVEVPRPSTDSTIKLKLMNRDAPATYGNSSPSLDTITTNYIDTTPVIPPEERVLSSMLVKGAFVNYGQPVSLTIKLENLGLDEIVLFLNNRRIDAQLQPSGDRTFSYPMRSADRTYKAVIIDKVNEKKYEKTIPGSRSSTWRIGLKEK